MEFSFNNVGVEKVSSVPMKGRSWSRREMSEVLSEVSFSLTSETMACVDKPAPMPSAVLAVRKLRRPMGFMSVPLFRRLCGEASVRHPSARRFRGSSRPARAPRQRSGRRTARRCAAAVVELTTARVRAVRADRGGPAQLSACDPACGDRERRRLRPGGRLEPQPAGLRFPRWCCVDCHH